MKIVNPPSHMASKMNAQDLLASIHIPKPDPSPVTVELYSPSLRTVLLFIATVQAANLITLAILLIYIAVRR